MKAWHVLSTVALGIYVSSYIVPFVVNAESGGAAAVITMAALQSGSVSLWVIALLLAGKHDRKAMREWEEKYGSG